MKGSVEKSRQRSPTRQSRYGDGARSLPSPERLRAGSSPFAVLTYWLYAPRV